MIRVLLVDDHSLVRAGLRRVIDEAADITVVAEACNGQESITEFAKVNPDVVVMDISMPRMDGMEAARRLLALHIHTPLDLVNGYYRPFTRFTSGSTHMDEIKSAKEQIRKDIAKTLNSVTEKLRTEKTKAIEARLFGFANFLEARIALLYIERENEVRTKSIIKRAYDFNRIVVLPALDPERLKVAILKVDHPDKDLVPGPRGVAEPNPARCKPVPLQKIDIAIIPGLAFDEKGARIGSGQRLLRSVYSRPSGHDTNRPY